jgi:hypothetical protein
VGLFPVCGGGGGRGGGGGGGGGAGSGRDLASLFDLEMDTQKNQYETADAAASPAEQQAKKVDDALAKLDALAKRQEELAQKQGNQAQNFQQRWQQEMLRREAEQLQREMEQMQGQQNAGNREQGTGNEAEQGQSGEQGRQGQSGQQGQSRQQGGRSGQAGGSQTASRGTQDGGADPRVSQALERLRAANDAMSRAGGQQQGGAQSAEEAKRAADRLREATDLLGGAQKQQASGKLDQMGRDADRLAKEENAQAERVQKLAAAGKAMEDKSAAGGQLDQAEMAAAQKERESLANDRQQMSDQLEKLQTQMRAAARELAPTQPGAAASLRDGLNGLDQNDLTNLVQRTADWLRRGINPNSNGTEAEIAGGLKKLDEQVRKAQQAAGSGQNGRPGPDAGTETAALDHVDRLRRQLEGLTGAPSGQNGRQPGQEQNGKQGGQAGQRGQGGQQGQGQQGNEQQARQGQNGQGGRGGQQGRANQPGQAGRLGGGQYGGNGSNGELRGGGGTDVANYNVDTGGQTYGAARNPRAPQIGGNAADTQRVIDQGLGELNQLRQLAKSDPAAEKQIQELAQEMQKLDPSRFKGNPAMVEELHAKVLSDVDKLELQLQRDPNAAQAGQVRTAKSPGVPAGYEDAVAEYYRRLGKGQ